MRVVSEAEFSKELRSILDVMTSYKNYDFVTGPGRSGAIASAYASHYTGIPFLPYGTAVSGRVLIVDTAVKSGRTIRKAMRKHGTEDACWAFNEPPRVRFWYEF